jgi:hypothetical protein
MQRETRGKIKLKLHILDENQHEMFIHVSASLTKPYASSNKNSTNPPQKSQQKLFKSRKTQMNQEANKIFLLAQMALDSALHLKVFLT